MQKLLEQRTGSGAQRNSWKSSQLFVVLACIALAAYLALVVLPTLSQGYIGEDEPLPARPKPTLPAALVKVNPTTVKPQESYEEKETLLMTVPSEAKREGVVPVGEAPMLEPWGYNKNRNIPRWKALWRSIADDVAKEGDTFTLIDYGSDQGFFSVSVAKSFPNALVMGIEAGGDGGSIWNKKAKVQIDVLEIQESKFREHHLNNVLICQTKAHQDQFTQLREKGLVSRYQFVLSVFHWFQLPTAEAFQKAVCTLFLNAKTTFIELPTIGDRSALIKKQVGWDNWSKWYAGHDSVDSLLKTAAQAQGLKVKVTKIASLPWIRWTRDVYRVDVLDDQDEAHKQAKPSPATFGCEERKTIYGCAKREKHATCPAGY